MYDISDWIVGLLNTTVADSRVCRCISLMIILLLYCSDIVFTIVVLSHCNARDTMTNSYLKMPKCENKMKH